MPNPAVLPANLPPLLRQLHQMRGEVGAASARVIDRILAQPEQFLRWTIADLSEAANASEATVVRLVQSLGFKSYQEFKLKLSRTLASSDKHGGHVVEPYDTPLTVLSKVFGATAVSLADTLEHLDPAAFSDSVTALSQARRIEFIGSGSSGLIALDAYQKFIKLGLLCGASTDPHNFTQVCALLEPADVVVAVSYSGTNFDTLHGARLAKESGATVIVITGLGKSPLSRLASHVLTSSSPADRYRPESVASRLAQLCITDALVASLHLMSEPYASRRLEKIERALKSRK